MTPGRLITTLTSTCAWSSPRGWAGGPTADQVHDRDLSLCLAPPDSPNALLVVTSRGVVGWVAAHLFDPVAPSSALRAA